MKSIRLRVAVTRFAPTKLEARRFVIDVNELGEAEIRYAGDPVANRDKSCVMHVEGALVELEVEVES